MALSPILHILYRYYIECIVEKGHHVTSLKLKNISEGLAEYCLSNATKDRSYLQVLYDYLWPEAPKHCVCGKQLKFYNVRHGYMKHPFCSSKCAGSVDSVKKKRLATCMDKYGVRAVQCVSEFREKFKQSMLTNHGVEYSGQSSEIRKKMAKTVFKKYGVRHATQAKSVQ